MEGLSLAFDDGTPFVDVAAGVRGVVPILIILDLLKFVSFLLQRFLYPKGTRL